MILKFSFVDEDENDDILVPDTTYQFDDSLIDRYYTGVYPRVPKGAVELASQGYRAEIIIAYHLYCVDDDIFSATIEEAAQIVDHEIEENGL
jgi:hypothetical protein